MKREPLIILGLVSITLLAFVGVGSCAFVNFDDYGYVANNAHVLSGLSVDNFMWAWTTFEQGNYLPLTWLSFMLDATLFGKGPHGFHWVNLGFHVANVVLVYLIFRKATGAVWRSALIAAVFAVHPLRVESVAWVVERKDVLTAFFGFLTMLAYLRFARTLNGLARADDAKTCGGFAPSPLYSGERAGARGRFASGATRSMVPHPNPLPRVRGRGDRKEPHELAQGYPGPATQQAPPVPSPAVPHQRTDSAGDGTPGSEVLRRAGSESDRPGSWEYLRDRRLFRVLDFATKPGWAYAVMLLLFALTLLAKQTMATLPCVLLLMDYWPLGRWSGGPAGVNPDPFPRRPLPQLIVEKLPLLAMSAGIIRVTMMAQKSTHSMADLKAVSLAWRLGNIPVSYARYLGKMVWFGNLAPLYPRLPWSAAQIAGSCLLLLLITAICLWKFRSRPWLMIGWLWFLGVLIPMNGVAQFGPQAMADRFTYFAGIGLLVMLAWSIPASVGDRPVWIVAVAGTALTLMILFTMIQTQYWRDSVSLFTHEIEVAGSSGSAEFILGKALRDRGKPGDMKNAIDHMQIALNLDSTNPEAFGDLALAMAFDKQYGRALPLSLIALQMDPKNVNWHIVHAYILQNTGHPDDAIAEADAALAINHGSAYAYRVKALALESKGDTRESIAELKKALAIEPNLKDGRADLNRLQQALDKTR